MPINEWGLVRTADLGLSSLSQQSATFDRSGALVVMDFFAKAILDGHGYQVRAGTISVPLVGDVLITDTAAEFCVDPGSGKVIIPLRQNISLNIYPGTAGEIATKSVASASSSGTAFVLLPINSTGQAAAVSTARVQAAGNVTVTAELATTTKFHYGVGGMAIAGGAYAAVSEWEPLRPPRIDNGWCLYTQIAAATTGPSYFANLDVLEMGVGQV